MAVAAGRVVGDGTGLGVFVGAVVGVACGAGATFATESESSGTGVGVGSSSPHAAITSTALTKIVDTRNLNTFKTSPRWVTRPEQIRSHLINYPSVTG